MLKQIQTLINPTETGDRLAMNPHLSKWFNHVLCFGLIILSIIVNFPLQAQNSPGSEAQLIKDADACFNNDDYSDAFPLYSQLLSLYPTNPKYNYRLGACMLFIKADKEKPIDYIANAVHQPGVDAIAWYYLGRAYHLNYKFDAAIRAYKQFAQIASASEIKKYPVDHLIDMCNNGKTLLKNMQELDVLVKKEVNISDYFQGYDLSNNGGSVIIEPDDFKTRLDKKKGATSVMYLSADKNIVFFSSYGDNDKDGKDIYEKKRLPDGSFGKPVNLGKVINTPYDEDYPFYDEPTHTLYFCSKGHNSMGGYDVFKSNFDDASQTWSSPVNMDFPINTPDDDILFIADTMNQTAYFASTRESPMGSIDIYKIKIQPHPPEFIVLNGITYSDSGSVITSSRITVKDFKSDQVTGIYNSSSQYGTYLMNLTNGGKFVFTVETEGHKTQSAPVLLPPEPTEITLKQTISYEPGTDKLIIKNNFQSSDSDYLLALNYIKQKAQMEVHTDTASHALQNNAQQVASTAGANSAASSNQQQPAADTGTNTNGKSYIPDFTSSSNNGNLTNRQLVKIDSEDAGQQEQTAKNMKEDADKTTSFANDKLMQAEDLKEKALLLADSANNISNLSSKNDSIAKSAALLAHANELEKKAMEAYQLAAEEQTDASTKQQQADLSVKYSMKLDSASRTSDNIKAIKELQKQETELRYQQQSSPPAKTTPADLIRRQADNVKLDSVQLAKQSEEIEKEIPQLEQQSQGYVNQAQTTNNAQEKIALLQQAKDLTESKKQKERELADNAIREKQLGEEHMQTLAAANSADSAKNAVSPQGVASQFADSAGLKQEIAGYTPASSNVSGSTQNQQPENLALTTTVNNNSATIQNSDNNLQSSNQNISTGQNVQTINTNAQNSGVQTGEVSANSQSNNPSINQQGKNINSNNSSGSDSLKHAIQNSGQMATGTADNETTQNQSSSASSSPTTLSTTKVFYSDPGAGKAGTEGAKLIADATILSQEAGDARRQAEESKDTTIQRILYHRADSLDNVGDKEKLQGATVSVIADSNQYQSNAQKLGAWKTYKIHTDDSDKITTARLLMEDGGFYFTKSLSEKQRADNMSKSYLKETFMELAKQDVETALLKQQTAENIYLGFNPALANINTPNPANASNSAVIQAEQTVANASQNPSGSEPVSANNTNQQLNNVNGSQNPVTGAGQNNSSSMQNGNNNSENTSPSANNTNTGTVNGSQNQVTVANQNNSSSMQNGNNNSETTSPSANNTNTGTVNGTTNQVTALGQNNSSSMQNGNNNSVTTSPSANNTNTGTVNGATNQVTALGQNNAVSGQNSNTQSAAGNSPQNNGNASFQQAKRIDSALSGSNAVDTQRLASLNRNMNTTVPQPPAPVSTPTLTASQDSSVTASRALSALSVAPAADLTVTVTINHKSNIKGFAKLEETIPDGFTVQPLKKSGSSFSVDNNNVKFVWFTVPPEPTFTVSYILTPKSTTSGAQTIKGEFSYLMDESATSLNLPLSTVLVQNGSMPVTANIQENNGAQNGQNNSVSQPTNNNPPTASASSQQNSSNEGNAQSGQNNSVSQPTNNNPATSNTSAQQNTSNEGNAQSGQNNNVSQSTNNNPITANASSQQNTSNEGNAQSGQNNSVNQSTNNNPATANASSQLNSSNEGNAQSGQNNSVSQSINNNPATANVTAPPTNENNMPDANSNNSEIGNNATTVSIISDVFEELPASPYSKAKPIPVNPPLPSGLIYKVQVGAFRNPIAQNLFKGLNPISGEKTANGLTRYTAGLFKEYGGAKDAEDKIHQLGYRDAFIVAFLNGKRIPLAQAEGVPATTSKSNPVAAVNPPAEAATNGVPAAPSTSVKEVKGLFYTVQVGAFEHPVSSSRLYNLTPLFSYNATNGYIRYNCGIYSTAVKAGDAKRVIIGNTPVKDAFVTAYYNGERINIDKAGQLLKNDSAVIPQDQNLDRMPPLGNNNGLQQNAPLPSENPQPAVIPSSNASTGKVIFKVQVGAYAGSIPIDMANNLLKISNQGLQSHKEANGITTYTVGEYPDYTSANLLKKELIKGGFPQSFIVAYSNGKKITLREAQALLNK